LKPPRAPGPGGYYFLTLVVPRADTLGRMG
jgi:hypothetical protein